MLPSLVPASHILRSQGRQGNGAAPEQIKLNGKLVLPDRIELYEIQ